MKHTRRWLAFAGAIALAVTLAVSPAMTASAQADTVATNCDGNAYVSLVEVQDFTDGQFEIKTWPTSNTRYAAWGGYELDAMNEIWHAVQACVPGLYGSLADGIYQQIECHVVGTIGGPLDFGGDTFDFESWRGTTDPSNEIPTECNWGGWPYTPIGEPYRTDRPANDPTF
ncbi:hypothetical protein [Jatrophihabitans lederbergiae]|uniref:Secreted protein n=1 Tax=Jatrophihabitans lederbergiae TaxID=3075547 RepID=A0ABU2JGK5_9ACTN|nr:hypothetical protein [Jatrophihabitans sp. DSM 44399]MDT0264104.1 hypothetical protein [Jatrophihabitans sp. DSM 44399]